jgi:universal stress protein A
MIRDILVPMDTSACSAAALELASSLAEQLGAEVHVLHLRGQDDFHLGSTAPLAPGERARAERQMEEVVSKARGTLGDRLHYRVETGEPLRRILEVAGEGRHDLVVMGTHGRTGRLRGLVGSVTEAVVRRSPCPVLTVRVPEGAESFSERIHHRA